MRRTYDVMDDARHQPQQRRRQANESVLMTPRPLHSGLTWLHVDTTTESSPHNRVLPTASYHNRLITTCLQHNNVPQCMLAGFIFITREGCDWQNIYESFKVKKSTRHRATTSMYSLIFRVRVTTFRSMDEMERRTQQARRFYRWRGESSPACVGMRPRTDKHTQTHTQTRVTTIHFASSTTHAKCNNLE